MKLIMLPLLLEVMCLFFISYSMDNNELKQLPKNSLENLTKAKRLVGKAEWIMAGLQYSSVRRRYITPEEQIKYINTEKGKAILFAQQAIPFVTAVINDNSKTTEVVKIFKRIEIIIR